jgi:hypothetical protein
MHYGAYEKVSTHPGYPYHNAYEQASTHPGHSGSLLFATPGRTYERCGVRKVSKSEIPVFDENIQIICLKLIFKEFVCKLKPIIIESYTESNELLKITRLCNPVVCSGLLLKQTQAYIYIRLIAY